MGVKNKSFYTATEHYTLRCHERFEVPQNKLESLKFFRKHSDSCDYMGTNNANGKSCEVWQNDEVIFILDPSKFTIVTTYPIEYNYIEGDKGYDVNNQSLGDEIVSNLEKSIDQEIYNSYVGFVDKNEEDINKVVSLMIALKKTRRRDYRENQINELESILSGVTNSLRTTNGTKVKLEGIKSNLMK